MLDLEQGYDGQIYLKSYGFNTKRTILNWQQCLDLDMFEDGSDFDFEKAKKYYC